GHRRRAGGVSGEVARYRHRGNDVLPRSRDAGRLRPTRHAPLARGAVRLHVAQRPAGHGLLQDPGGPGVRGRSAGGTVKLKKVGGGWHVGGTTSTILHQPPQPPPSYSTCPNFAMSSGKASCVACVSLP